MNIGIDIDDTIANTSEIIDLYAKEYTENVLKRELKLNEIDILDPMWAKHLFGWTIEEDKEFWDLYYEQIMRDVKPKNDSVEIINELSKENTIIIISARWDRENGIIGKITKNWLEKYNIHHDKQFIGHLDKRNIVKENNIELFIDDSYKTCKLISDIGIKTLLMNSRLNKNIEIGKMERVSSWKEIKEKVKNLRRQNNEYN